MNDKYREWRNNGDSTASAQHSFVGARRLYPVTLDEFVLAIEFSSHDYRGSTSSSMSNPVQGPAFRRKK